MIKIKLLITTGLLALLIPILDKGIRQINLVELEKKQEVLALNLSNEISQTISTKQIQTSPASQSVQIAQQTARPAGFCLNVPILMYHHIQPQTIAVEKWQTALNVDTSVFDSQMAHLAAAGYRTISIDELVQVLINHQKLDKVAVLTFDDGYEDFYTFAFPIIKKYNLRASLFVSTGLVQNQDYLTWNQLKEMQASGQVFTYNHSWSHTNLASANQAKIESEVQTAQKQFADYLGSSPKIFAYPYGQISQTIINYLVKNGFLAAVSTIQGQTQCESNIFSLQRIRIGNSQLSAYGI